MIHPPDDDDDDVDEKHHYFSHGEPPAARVHDDKRVRERETGGFCLPQGVGFVMLQLQSFPAASSLANNKFFSLIHNDELCGVEALSTRQKHTALWTTQNCGSGKRGVWKFQTGQSDLLFLLHIVGYYTHPTKR